MDGVVDAVVESLARRWEALRPHLTERQRRLWLGLRPGSWALAAQNAWRSPWVWRPIPCGVAARSWTIPRFPHRGVHANPGAAANELRSNSRAWNKRWTRWWSRPPAGIPYRPCLRWTTKSLRELTDALRGKGFKLTDKVVWRLLKAAGYSLQANAKTAEGRQHPDRDGQFRYINDAVRTHQADGQPVISVD